MDKSSGCLHLVRVRHLGCQAQERIPKRVLQTLITAIPVPRSPSKRMLFKIAWDRETSAVTFLLTEDPHLVTDSELGVGGGCRLLDGADQPYPLTPYLGWLFTPMWADSAEDLSGDAVWYAALRKESTPLPYGKIVGFVQSGYLKLKE